MLERDSQQADTRGESTPGSREWHRARAPFFIAVLPENCSQLVGCKEAKSHMVGTRSLAGWRIRGRTPVATTVGKRGIPERRKQGGSRGL